MSGAADRFAALHEAERRVAAQPAAIEPRFDRARALEDLGRDAEAQAAYIELIGFAPSHFGTLNNLGNLLERTGYRRAARLTYAEAIKWHPNNPIAYVNLGNSFLDADDLPAAREQYEAAIRLQPDHPEAHQGMAYVFERLGDEAAAQAHRERGFRSRALTRMPFRGEGTPVAALLLVSAAGGNIFTRDFLDDRTFGVSRIFAEYVAPDEPLPPHAFTFNAIADADRCTIALRAASEILKRSTAPAINRPDAVLRTERRAVADGLRAIPGVRVPAILPLPRAAFLEPDAPALARAGFSYPLLVRTPGHHTGRYFELVENATRAAAVATSLPGDELLAIEYLDARGNDGKARKYRAIFVDGCVYPLHLAISGDWKVHYFSADMDSSPEHRTEEERFLNDPEATLGRPALEALRRIAAHLDLDYAGIDFGLGPRGEVLVFEANAAMIVPPVDPDPRWAYRRPHVERIFRAVRAMLFARAGVAGA